MLGYELEGRMIYEGFPMSVVLGSEDGDSQTFWLLLYSIALFVGGSFGASSVSNIYQISQTYLQMRLVEPLGIYIHKAGYLNTGLLYELAEKGQSSNSLGGLWVSV